MRFETLNSGTCETAGAAILSGVTEMHPDDATRTMLEMLGYGLASGEYIIMRIRDTEEGGVTWR